MEIMETVAQLMALSARTAPKATGKDFVETRVLVGDDVTRLADAMEAYGQESGKKGFDRDGGNVRNSAAVLLVSLRAAQKANLNCGACGYDQCNRLPQFEGEAGCEFLGPICAWRIMDLGIAIGSAVKTASLLNADNRIMYRIGVAARKQGFIDGELVVGIPLSASGKNIYFDR